MMLPQILPHQEGFEGCSPRRYSATGRTLGFLKNAVSRIANPAKAAAIQKLDLKLPVFSASIPATAGPVIWPKPKMNVTSPNAAAALRAPT